ncbi:MAG: translation elongation factor 4, partial [bacterium]|nr:translation elongation factor 4 [bacterium]
MNNIRNFCIIAHVDHGKSTLADRFLDITGTIEKRKMQEQFLDLMPLEREKGITIKMQPVRMQYGGYTLNLIDTPGHVDFSYEVSRSLAAVEGAILLVDATKGVQAQTLANLRLAQKQNLMVIPAVNKIDLQSARTEEVVYQIAKLCGVSSEEVFRISAKEGKNVKELLEAVIRKVPPPKEETEKPLRALIFDSRYDPFRGVVAYVRVMEGRVTAQEKVWLLGGNTQTLVKEVGHFIPAEKQMAELRAGEIGYISTGFKEPENIRIGDTIAKDFHLEQALPGFLIPKPVVFVSFYPEDTDEYDVLKDALSKLRLNDPSLSFELESKEALGRGFRCGFLGVLHSEIIAERLKREFQIDLVISRPSVEFRITDQKGKERIIQSAGDWPEQNFVQEAFEPWAKLRVLCPVEFLHRAVQLLESLEGHGVETTSLTETTMVLVYEMPLREIIINLHDRLKSVTSGFASLEYEVIGMRKAALVKLDILVAEEKREELSQIVPEDKAIYEGKRIVEKLKEHLPPQMFTVALQAVLGGKIIARETIKAKRRDVTAPLYGGDVTRKKKLLERQRKGKKE